MCGLFESGFETVDSRLLSHNCYLLSSDETMFMGPLFSVLRTKVVKTKLFFRS